MPFLTRFLLFVAIALALGLGTAWRAVSHGFFASTVRFGPWAYWFRQGTADADPYTVAHIAREGTLPITATSDMTFTATRDSAGAWSCMMPGLLAVITSPWRFKLLGGISAST